MNRDTAGEIISHVQAYDDNWYVPDTAQERIRWAQRQRTLLHAAQTAILSEMEDIYHIEQVARGEQYGAE